MLWTKCRGQYELSALAHTNVWPTPAHPAVFGAPVTFPDFASQLFSGTGHRDRATFAVHLELHALDGELNESRLYRPRQLFSGVISISESINLGVCLQFLHDSNIDAIPVSFLEFISRGVR